jgi:putative effector of murein hydrolase
MLSMAGAKGRTSVFATLVSKATTAVTSPCATTIAAAMERARQATAVSVIQTGQAIDVILRLAPTFRDVQVMGTVTEMLAALANPDGLE